MFTKPPNLTDQQKTDLFKGKALRSANFQGIDEDTGEMVFDFSYTYEGTLEFYFETGMEGHSSNLHDNRGWHDAPTFNNETRAFDGPTQRCKSLEWCVFLKGGEYLEVFNSDNEILWEGLMVNDPVACSLHNYALHFIPQGIPLEQWRIMCQDEYKAKVYTNEPVMAEDPNHQEYLNSQNSK